MATLYELSDVQLINIKYRSNKMKHSTVTPKLHSKLHQMATDLI